MAEAAKQDSRITNFQKIFEIKNHIIFYSNFSNLQLNIIYFTQAFFDRHIQKEDALSDMVRSSKIIFDTILSLFIDIEKSNDETIINGIISQINHNYEENVKQTLIYSIFNESDVILINKRQIIINLYTSVYKNTIPISIFSKIESFGTELTLHDNNQYGVKMIFAKSIINCVDNNDFEIIYDNFNKESEIKHKLLDFFNEENQTFLNKDNKNYVFDKLELIRNIYPKYWIDIAEKTKSNIVIFLGRKACLCNKFLNLYNIYMKYLGINYAKNNTVNILISCNNTKCAEDLCYNEVYPQFSHSSVSVLGFEDRVGLYNNYIFACRSIHLTSIPLFTSNIYSVLHNKHINEFLKHPIVFDTDVKDDDSYISFVNKNIFNVISKKYKDKVPKIENFTKLPKDDAILRDDINTLYLVIVENAKVEIQRKKTNKVDKDILHNLIGNLEQNKDKFIEKYYNYLKSGQQLHIEIDRSPSKIISDQIATNFKVNTIEFMNLINEINAHHIFFLDHNLNQIANKEKNSNKYRIKFKELLNKQYNSACNLCLNIETLISNISSIKGVKINTVDDPTRRCSVWNKLDTESQKIIEQNNINYENNINLKILIEIMINKFKINPTIRKQIYDTLNTLADTTNDMNIFNNNGKKIIDSLVICLITQSPVENYIHESFNKYEKLTHEDNYYFENDRFKIEYDNLIQIINFFQNHVKEYIESYHSDEPLKRHLSCP